jgi:hypothetical protein
MAHLLRGSTHSSTSIDAARQGMSKPGRAHNEPQLTCTSTDHIRRQRRNTTHKRARPSLSPWVRQKGFAVHSPQRSCRNAQPGTSAHLFLTKQQNQRMVTQTGAMWRGDVQDGAVFPSVSGLVDRPQYKLRSNTAPEQPAVACMLPQTHQAYGLCEYCVTQQPADASATPHKQRLHLHAYFPGCFETTLVQLARFAVTGQYLHYKLCTRQACRITIAAPA